MKAVCKKLLALALVLACALWASALAEGAPTPPPLRRVLDIYCSSRPAELVTAGEVMLSFSIANNSESDARNVYLISSDGLHSEPLGQIAAGESQIFNRTYAVSDAELASGEISFIVSHDPQTPGGEPVRYTVSTPIARSIAAPRAEFTTQLSADCVSAGGTITITYRVRNTGNVPLAQLRVNDTLGDFVGRAEALDIGETRVFTSRITVSGSVRSEPSLSYAVPAEDGKVYESELSPRTIEIARPELAASFAADVEAAEPGGNVMLTLMLRNLGNADFHSIAVTDAVRGGLVASSLALAAGDEPLLVSRVYPVRGDAEYQFHIEALCETGERVSLDTERVTVPVKPITGAGGLELRAEARTPRLRRGGSVAFDIQLSAADPQGVRDVRLSEQTRGEVRTFAIIPAGKPTEIQAVYPINESAELTFVAEWTDGEGTHIVRALPVAVEIAPDGAEPLEAERQNGLLSGPRVRLGETSIYLFLVIGTAIVLVGLVLALWITHRRERKARQERAAQQQRQRRREELEKTNHYVPIKLTEGRRERKKREKKAKEEGDAERRGQ